MDGIGATVWKKIFRGLQKRSAQLEPNKSPRRPRLVTITFAILPGPIRTGPKILGAESEV